MSLTRGVGVYALTIFLSAFLLFQVQLIMGKYVLPWYGGTPAVWNTCMLVYQVLLLAGYAYAHMLAGRLGAREQAWTHLAVLGLSVAVLGTLGLSWTTPLTPGAHWKPTHGGDPVWQIALLLGATIALPFFILSTTGPLLQAWFSRTHPGQSPYRLYALSNLGSLLGLLSYPFLVERWLSVERQAWMWVTTYAVFAAACGATAWRLAGSGAAPAPPSAASGGGTAPSIGRRGLWLALAACASVMLLGTTNLLSQEIGVIPFLWVLGLSLYLLSFVICFENERWYHRGVFQGFFLLALLAALVALRPGPDAPVVSQLIACSTALFAVCMVCHGELVRMKPAVNYLTSFYLTIAGGGALGGVFVVLVAPQIFSYIWEFQLGLVGAAVLLIVVVWQDAHSWLHRAGAWAPAVVILGAALLPKVDALGAAGWWGPLERSEVYFIFLVLAVALAAVPLVISTGKPQLFRAHVLTGSLAVAVAGLGYIAYMQQAAWQGGILQIRNFFGMKALIEDQNGLWFKHGVTFHGLQLRDPRHRMEPTLYFSRGSAIGLLLDSYPRPASGGLRVGIVGLGIATLATYAREDDYYRFYEIDPQVSAFSSGPRPRFTFLRDAKGRRDVILGDARLMLESELARGEPQQFDILVLDAFSSDSIPVHLVTTEALALYRKHLRGPDSVLAFNVSNQHVDMAPLLLRTSREHQMAFAALAQSGVSRWVLMSANAERVKISGRNTRPQEIPYREDLPIWTDNFSNLFDVLARP